MLHQKKDIDLGIDSSFIKTYLEYVEDTESPRIYHVWCALGGIGAALERRVFFPFGVNDVFANMYIFLVGPPAVRKSTALKVLKDLLDNSTNVKFAPDDTSGKKQGILSAFLADEDSEKDQELMANLEDSLSQETDFASLVAKAKAGDPLELLASADVSIENKRVMLALASELATFLGVNSPEMMPFLTKLWDGEPYKYQLKNETRDLRDALISIIGATTPSGISRSMPPEAMDQGFLSRVIMVYAGKKYKSIPRPSRLPEEQGNFLRDHFSKINYMSGAMGETSAAGKLIDKVYEEEVKIQDPRFIYYKERRHTHMIKTAMCFAASRNELLIREDDVQHAHLLLKYTESNMQEALGEYGMTKLSVAKQQIMEFIKYSKDPIPTSVIFTFMRKNISQMELRNIVHELEAAEQIKTVRVAGVDAPCLTWVDKKTSKQDKDILSLLD